VAELNDANLKLKEAVENLAAEKKQLSEKLAAGSRVSEGKKEDATVPAEPAPQSAPAQVKAVTNSIGIEFVEIPAGKFQMGEGDKAVAVTLTRPFWLGKTEVTRGQWEQVMGTKPWAGEAGSSDAELPAVYVSWEDAREFCEKLTARERSNGELQASEVYRLPTEAEWEYACRAGTTTAFSVGDEESELHDYAWFGGNSGGEVQKAATKKPNPWGVHDMHGNVWEWCSDWFDGKLAGGVDPTGPATGSIRLNRGGSWLDDEVGCRSAYRDDGDVPSYRDNRLGFRVVRSQSVKYSAKPDFAANREAAGWVLRLKGSVDVEDPSGKREHINSSERLPAGQFAVIGINLPPGSNIPAADFGVLRNLQTLEILGLGGIPVTDDVFDHISDLPSLKHLGVNWTQVTGEGLAKLKNARLVGIDVGGVRNIMPALQRFKAMGTIESINFDRVDVPPAGFVLIGQMKTLKQMWFRNGLVPRDQLDFLRKELPKCNISIHQ
jgi:formylglycine-generating enzyme required for sulfatase activity